VDEIMQIADTLPAHADAYFHEQCGTRGGAVYALHSRCNHSCEPVAEVRCGAFPTHTLDVVAVRDIFAGDPITITYVDPKLRWIKRCELLQRNYGFICACAACAREFSQPVAGSEDDESEGEDDDTKSDSSECAIPTELVDELQDALGN